MLQITQPLISIDVEWITSNGWTDEHKRATDRQQPQQQKHPVDHVSFFQVFNYRAFCSTAAAISWGQDRQLETQTRPKYQGTDWGTGGRTAGQTTRSTTTALAAAAIITATTKVCPSVCLSLRPIGESVSGVAVCRL